jgi:metal-responsive CopG/Arc/MetJ family transcriptional regulator
MSSFNKIIQVPLDEQLLAELDRASREGKRSRAALIREACQRYLRQLREAAQDDAYEQGYRRHPESPVIGEAQAAITAEVLPEEAW